jgi:hypothetical protein
MYASQVGVVSNDWLILIDSLQKQEIGDIGSSTSPARRYARSECFATVMEETLKFVYKST